MKYTFKILSRFSRGWQSICDNLRRDFKPAFLPPINASHYLLLKEISTKFSPNSAINMSRKVATVITGDSTISDLGGNKTLSGRNIKLDSFSGEKINGKYFELVPLHLKRPAKIVLHIGTHGTTFMDANGLLKCISNLKSFVLKIILGWTFYCQRRIRRSHWRRSLRKGALRNFAKFAGKHLCQSLFFNKFEGLMPATLFKKETLVQVFSYEFCEISEIILINEPSCYKNPLHPSCVSFSLQ